MPSKSKGQLEEAYTEIHIQISSFIIRDQPQEANNHPQQTHFNQAKT